MASDYCAVNHQRARFPSLCACIPSIILSLNCFFLSHQNTCKHSSNFLLLLNMSILFANIHLSFILSSTMPLHIICHVGAMISVPIARQRCASPTCLSCVFSLALGISISLHFIPNSPPAFGHMIAFLLEQRGQSFSLQVTP